MHLSLFKNWTQSNPMRPWQVRIELIQSLSNDSVPQSILNSASERMRANTSFQAELYFLPQIFRHSVRSRGKSAYRIGDDGYRP